MERPNYHDSADETTQIIPLQEIYDKLEQKRQYLESLESLTGSEADQLELVKENLEQIKDRIENGPMEQDTIMSVEPVSVRTNEESRDHRIDDEDEDEGTVAFNVRKVLKKADKILSQREDEER